MKPIPGISMVVILFWGILLSCGKPQPMTIITGRMEEGTSPFLVLCKDSERYGFRDWLPTLDTAHLEEDGSFRFAFEAKEPDFYQLCDDRGYPVTVSLWLAPGDSLDVIGARKENRMVFRYGGAHAGAYAYYTQRDSLYRQEPLYGDAYEDEYELPIDTFTQLQQRRLDWEKSLIRSVFGDTPEWQQIRRHVEDERRYSNYENYFRYLYYHYYYTQDTFIYLIPDTTFYAFMRDIDLTYVPSSYMYEYQRFLGAYIENRIEYVYGDLPDSTRFSKDLSHRFEIIRKEFTGRARDMAILSMGQNFGHALEHDDFFEITDSLKTFLTQDGTDPLVLKKFLAIKSGYDQLKPGAPAPDIALPDIQGDTIRLSDLRGKVLYIDFWGTWCYPCLQELPNSLVLHEKFKDDPVEFVFIGLESGEEQVTRWREFITGQKGISYASFLPRQVYPGIHLLAEGQMGNPQIRPYKISFAPTYMLIDAEGRIVTARAPRPGREKTEMMIRDLLATM